jgi:choline dehydrogenase-like flavoprotein
MTIAIVGSGPAGVSAAFCLLRKGLAVTMLDVGYRLEPTRQQLVARLASTGPEDWDKGSLAQLREATDPDVRGLPRKLVYGSDYAYRAPEDLVRIEARGVDLLVSHALGGLSSAWGSNVLPVGDRDIKDWPISVAELAPYYRAVFSFVDLSARQDRLGSRYPLYADSPRPLRASRQAQALLDDLEREHSLLSRLGFEFGSSRLAVRSYPKGGDAGCVYCGLCLYGCPYGLIYSSAHSLSELEAFPRFQYVPGLYIERVAEEHGGVSIHSRRLDTGRCERIAAERVFLGCGTVSTTKIVLESLDQRGREVLLRDSQYFLTPMIRRRGSPGVAQEQLHTLSQVCLELDDPAVSQRPIHMLIYTYNDLYSRALQKLLGPLFRPMGLLVDPLISRLVVVQGYLHSDDSPAIAMRVEGATGTTPARVLLEARTNPRTRPALRLVKKRLRQAAAALRGYQVPFMTHVGLPGKSYHAGGSLPMRHAPADLECDILGRPAGFARVHVIDASCFTSIPATNVTLTVMANAHRIADQGPDS